MFGTCLQNAGLPVPLPYGLSNGNTMPPSMPSCRMNVDSNAQRLVDTSQRGQFNKQADTQPESFEFEDTFDDDEDVDDDDFTEEEYNQMALPQAGGSTSMNTPDVSDITHQLLQFADLVNSDIQKFFGRKKGDKENVDIYEDRWKSSGKSGRELYYADLLRMAKGCDDVDDSKSNCKARNGSRENNLTQPMGSRSNEYSGKLDKKVGLGPLMELFQYGLRQYLDDKKLATFSKKIKRLQHDARKLEHTVPMQKRRFPESFWKEPTTETASGGQRTKSCEQSTTEQPKSKPNGLLNLSKPLDFSDLLESWAADDTDELSSPGDLSSTSSESAKD